MTLNDHRQWREAVKQRFPRGFVVTMYTRETDMAHSVVRSVIQQHNLWCLSGSAFVRIHKMLRNIAGFIVLFSTDVEVFTIENKIPTRATQITQFRERCGCVKIEKNTKHQELFLVFECARICQGKIESMEI